MSVSAIAMLGATNLLTSMTYAAATDYDALVDPITDNPLAFRMPNRNVYLYATTAPNHYFVEYHGHGHTSWDMDPQEFVYDEEQALSGNAFAKTWYVFSGWNTEEDESGSGYTDGEVVQKLTTESGGTVDLYAFWRARAYQIRYNLNEGSWSSAVVSGTRMPTELSYDQTWWIDAPSRKWYGFSGWDITNMDSESHIVGWETTSVTSANGVTGIEYKNLRADEDTVYFAARWTPQDVDYVVKYYLETLTGGVYQDPVVYTWSAPADSYVTGERNLYSWYDIPNLTGGVISPDGDTVFEYHYPRTSFLLTLIAGTWVDLAIASGTVSDGDSTNSSKDISFKYEEPITLSYALKSWYTTARWSGYEGEASGFNMPYENVTKEVYATTIPYTITGIYHWWQDASSGTIFVTGYTVESDDITLPAMLYRDHSEFSWRSARSAEGAG